MDQAPGAPVVPRASPPLRTLFTHALPPILVPPTIFLGLLFALWTWKCFWIVAMQEKLLYLTWLPPFARSEKIADYKAECGPVQWQEMRIRSLDGTPLALCEGRITGDTAPMPRTGKKSSVVICYFQGNGGSTPMRLPLLSQTLRAIDASATLASSSHPPREVCYTVVALSYRGYWSSSGHPTQSGIERDVQAFLDWVVETYAAPETDLRIILWGHSLGSAIASTGLASYLSRSGDGPIAGLVLEAPTSSVKDMLINLYPQKWLPYRYLWPFLRSHWDSTMAMERMAYWGHRSDAKHGRERSNGDGLVVRPTFIPPILILSAEKDEVIPPHAANDLETAGRSLGLDITRKQVLGAMHTEASVKAEGKRALVDFILRKRVVRVSSAATRKSSTH
ncbi:alpha/beta-hydrolase [Aspergillus heteromorphus CBS 117.55]|uniref:Alpha/beta-hydrolase n=1 Tax=Aspergillus heteromorphus CBS 117.55 TaxID=1448321 RepID=A0A317WNB3_9EURO|nr:alpha/beta-hydrolase [Aspergillus heteromorphus CBS 117.55]PWY86742.1 alpha/beta-hydrolase [Aspergillus heteromorphus CBS 117.55]